MAYIWYAGIEITTDVAATTDETIGLVSGVLRYVTGRPGFDGTYPGAVSGDGGFTTSTKFFENFITDDSLSNSSRDIDISEGGNYGTLSNFNFSLKNTGLIWKAFEQAGIYLSNRKVKHFIIRVDSVTFAAVFYQVWTGVAQDNPFDTREFKIQCADNFRAIHKPFPPTPLDSSVFPDLKETNKAQVVPVSIGYVNYARAINIQSNSGFEVMCNRELSFDNVESIYCYGVSYTEAPIPKIVIRHFSQFVANQLQGHQLIVVEGVHQSIVISGNTASVLHHTNGVNISDNWYETEISLDDIMDNTGIVFFVPSDTYPRITFDAPWIFSVSKIFNNFIVSNRPIDSFETYNSSGTAKLLYWRNDYSIFEDVSHIVKETDSTSIWAGYPGFQSISGSQVDVDNIKSWSPINSKKIEVFQNTGNWVPNSGTLNNILNRDRSSYSDFTLSSTNGLNKFKLRIPVPKLEDFSKYTKIYLLTDYALFGTSTADGAIRMQMGMKDLFGYYYQKTNSSNVDTEFSTGTFSIEKSYMHNTMYRPAISYSGLKAIDAGAPDTFYALKDANFEIVGYGLTSKKSDLFEHIEMLFAKVFGGTSSITLRIYHLGLFGEFNVSISTDPLYAKIKGELDGSSAFVENVADAIKYILVQYDGLDASNDIDSTAFTALADPTSRGNFYVGRQFSDQKTTFEYIKEACNQSMISIFPKRDGKRGVSAWWQNRTVLYSFDETNIIEETLKQVAFTPIGSVYNDFLFEYNYNPASSSFTKSIKITNAQEAAFPDPEQITYLVQDEATFTFGLVLNYPSFGFPFSSYMSFTLTAVDITQFFVGQDITFEGTYIASGLDCILNEATLGARVYVNSIVGNTVYIKSRNRASSAGIVTGTLYVYNSATTLSWKTFVGGVNSYPEAKNLWEYCHQAYLETKVIKPAPDSITKLSWYPDLEEFDGTTTVKPAELAATEIVQWATRRKRILTFSIPITSANLAIELLDPVDVTHSKLTNGASQQGWIVGLSTDHKRKKIDLKVMVKPNEATGICGIIDENGAVDIIDENGATDIIDENGC